MNNKKFTKNDLKVGYVVKDREGCLYMTMPAKDHEELCVIDAHGGWLSFTNFDSALRNTGCAGSKYDIMEVYDYCRYPNKSLHVSTDNRKLLWKREPEKTCDNCIHKPVCNHVGTCEHFMNKV